MSFKDIFSRIYIRIGGGYDVEVAVLKQLDMMNLLREIAKANPSGDGESLYDGRSEKIFEKRTKRFVVRRVDMFIAGIPDAPSEEENMAKFASIKQLNLLIRDFGEEKKRISGFSLVYIYIMYTLLEGKSPVAADCARYVRALCALVKGYLADHSDDEIAIFLVEGANVILTAIENQNTELAADQLPGRPCQNPKDIIVE